MRTGSLRPAAFFIGHMLALCLLYITYLMVRGLIAGYVDVQQATERSQDLVELERQLHISFEGPLQSLAMRVPLVISLLNAIYIWGHVPFLLGEFFWLHLKSPRSFAVLRNGLLLSTIPSIILYITLPMAPPRLNPALDLVDTVAGPNHSNYFIQPEIFANHFAAMPSMHVGWALAAGLAAFLAMGASRWRWLGLAMPVAMAASVMGTANHYVLDWVIGCAIAAASFWIASLWQQRREREQSS
jgi:hypothetical protein